MHGGNNLCEVAKRWPSNSFARLLLQQKHCVNKLHQTSIYLRTKSRIMQTRFLKAIRQTILSEFSAGRRYSYYRYRHHCYRYHYRYFQIRCKENQLHKTSIKVRFSCQNIQVKIPSYTSNALIKFHILKLNTMVRRNVIPNKNIYLILSIGKLLNGLILETTGCVASIATTEGEPRATATIYDFLALK